MNDIKWLVLLTSREPGVVQCELDKLGKLAGKTRGTQTGHGQDVTVGSQGRAAEIKEWLSTSTQPHQNSGATEELGPKTSQQNEVVI